MAEQLVEISETFEKRELIITLGEGETPASFRWKGVVFTKRQDGTEYFPPKVEERSASQEEVTNHIENSILQLNSQLIAKDRLIAEREQTLRQEAINTMEEKSTTISIQTAEIENLNNRLEIEANTIRNLNNQLDGLKNELRSLKEKTLFVISKLEELSS